ncbi:TlpA family protein disulfide reductase [Pedobacter suwonensis]|uniref:TlpA family protein disulfide reductase n=1 Tax=Pedobacter suwonensis TaxID=332999 RepID=UPI0011A7B97C|nr:TlpA disulfide reductase family protein [Pedobacter suwonensis]
MMKKTIYFIAKALLCNFFKPKISIETNFSENALNKFSKHVLDFTESEKLIKSVAALSFNEIKLERLKRKKNLVLLFLLINSISIQAQEKSQNYSIGIDKKIPNVFLSKVINYSATGIRLSDLKGKAVILDFWATFCSACLIEFPKMDSFQKQYNKNLQVILINTYSKDTEKVLGDFLVHQKSKLSGFSLPIAQSDSTLREIFPIKSMPHYIWVGSDGRIKAITRAEQVTAPNIERLIAGLSLNLKIKTD